jgi:hypothetical protein
VKSIFSTLLFSLFLWITAYSSDTTDVHSGKQRVIILRPSFLIASNNMFGEQYAIGFLQNRNYYGITLSTYDRGLTANYFDKTFGGVGFVYNFCKLLYSKYYLIAPGFTVGYWTHSYIYFDPTDYNIPFKSKQYTYLGGPNINMELGIKYVFLCVDETLLFGTGIINCLSFGFTIHF